MRGQPLTGGVQPGLGRAGRRQRWRSVLAGGERAPFGRQRLALALCRVAQPEQFDLPRRVPQTGLLAGALQRLGRRVVVSRGRVVAAPHPVAQRGERAGIVEAKLDQGRRMRRPGRYQRVALTFDLRLGAAPAFSRSLHLGAPLALVLFTLPQRQRRLLDKGMPALQQAELVASGDDRLAQRRLRRLELARRQIDQGGRGERQQRVGVDTGAQAGGVGLRRGLRANAEHRRLRLPCASGHGCAGRLLAPPALPRLALIGLRPGGRVGTPRRLLLGGLESVRILVDRVGLQGFPTAAFGRQRALGLRLAVQRIRFGPAGELQPVLRLVARLARVLELGLRLAQLSRLAPRQHPGVDAVALLETLDGACQARQLVELAAIFLELVEGLGHVRQQFLWQRRQRLGQRMRQARLVRLFRELRLTKLDQGVHQRVVAAWPEAKEPLVDGAAVAGGRFEHLAASDDCLAKFFTAAYQALFVREPEIQADPRPAAAYRVIEQEKPAFDLGSRGHSRMRRW